MCELDKESISNCHIYFWWIGSEKRSRFHESALTLLFKLDVDAEMFTRHHSHMSLYVEIASEVNICFEFFAVSFLNINKIQRSYETKTKPKNMNYRERMWSVNTSCQMKWLLKEASLCNVTWMFVIVFLSCRYCAIFSYTPSLCSNTLLCG